MNKKLINKVYLSLGSNKGDKEDYLEKAVEALDGNNAIHIEKISSYYETSPVGGVVQDDFVNMAIFLSTSYTAQELLDEIHKIELSLNRERLVHWGPRTIDIDIIFYNNEYLETENLIIPHKEAFNRLFVLVPLIEIIEEDSIYKNKITEHIVKLEKTEQLIKKVNK